jgi:hypothetical protein
MATPGPDPDYALIEAAATYLCRRGHVDPDLDGYIPADVAAELAELAAAGRCPSCPGAGLAPDALADHWETAKTEEYERSLPVWACDCGVSYKLLREPASPSSGRVEFYHARRGGLLGDAAGFAAYDSKGRVKRSSACPACGRRFADMLADRADPQLALFGVAEARPPGPS